MFSQPHQLGKPSVRFIPGVWGKGQWQATASCIHCEAFVSHTVEGDPPSFGMEASIENQNKAVAGIKAVGVCYPNARLRAWVYRWRRLRERIKPRGEWRMGTQEWLDAKFPPKGDAE